MKVCAVIDHLGEIRVVLGIFGCRFLFDFEINLFFGLVKLFKVVYLKVIVVIIRYPSPLILFFLLKFLVQLFVFEKKHRAALVFCLIQPFLFLIIILLLLTIYVFFLVQLQFDSQQHPFLLKILFFLLIIQ